MRLLIVTQYFPPEAGAPQTRLYELSSRLREMGHTVTILTAMPNHPTGKVFKGYRGKIRLTEQIDGIRVVRTCIIPSKSRKNLPRLLSYMTFVFSSVVFGRWGLGKQDVVLIESPPLFLVPAGLLIGKLAGGRIIMNCSDIWPDILIRRGHVTGGLGVKVMFWLEKYGYNHSDVVAVTNPGAMDQIRERFPHVTTTVISNGVDTKLFRPELRSDEIRADLGAGPDDLLAVYCGLHGLAQGLEVIVNAAARLGDRPDIKIVMIGDGPTKEDLLALAESKGVTNIRFMDRRPKNQMPPILASADVSLVPLDARLPGTMPSKTYEALASKTPPIVAKGCEADFLVTKYDAGKAYEPRDDAEFAQILRELADDRQQLRTLGENGYQLAKRFNRDTIAERTNQILIALAEGAELPEVAW